MRPQVLDASRDAMPVEVAWRGHQHVVQRRDRARHRALQVDAGGEAQRDVDPLLHQVDIAVGHAEDDTDVRIAVHEFRQQPGQLRIPEGHRGAHAQGAARPGLHAGGQGLDRLRLVQHALCVLEDRAARLAQPELAGRPVQQLRRQRLLQARHRLADVGLGASHPARRLGEGTGFHDPDEGPDVGQVAPLQPVHRLSCGNNQL